MWGPKLIRINPWNNSEEDNSRKFVTMAQKLHDIIKWNKLRELHRQRSILIFNLYPWWLNRIILTVWIQRSSLQIARVDVCDFCFDKHISEFDRKSIVEKALYSNSMTKHTRIRLQHNTKKLESNTKSKQNKVAKNSQVNCHKKSNSASKRNLIWKFL